MFEGKLKIDWTNDTTGNPMSPAMTISGRIIGVALRSNLNLRFMNEALFLSV